MKKRLLLLVFIGLCAQAEEAASKPKTKKIELRNVISLLNDEFLQLFYDLQEDRICFASFNGKGNAQSLLPLNMDQLSVGTKYERSITIKGIAQVEGTLLAVLLLSFNEREDTVVFLIFSPLQSVVKFARYNFEGKIRDIKLKETFDHKINASCLLDYNMPENKTKLVKIHLQFNRQCDMCSNPIVIEEYEGHILPVPEENNDQKSIQPGENQGAQATDQAQPANNEAQHVDQENQGAETNVVQGLVPAVC
jgi:hypothetical protein